MNIKSNISYYNNKMDISKNIYQELKKYFSTSDNTLNVDKTIPISYINNIQNDICLKKDLNISDQYCENEKALCFILSFVNRE